MEHTYQIANERASANDGAVESEEHNGLYFHQQEAESVNGVGVNGGLGL